jgi:phage-related tail protein
MIGLRAMPSMKQSHAGTKQIKAASTQMQLLLESDNAFPKSDNNADSSTTTICCSHGVDQHEPINQEFIDAFMNAYNASSSQLVGARLVDAINATAEKYATDVWESSKEMESIVSFFLDKGAKAILDGDNETARRFAVFASYFERCIVVEEATQVAQRKSPSYVRNSQELHNLKAQISRSWAKVGEVYTDENALVRHFRNRLPCSCLDDKYNEVASKSKKKKGICFNTMCSLPCYKVQHSATMCCSQCLQSIYCSRECQVIHWPSHGKICYEVAALKSAFSPISSSSSSESDKKPETH